MRSRRHLFIAAILLFVSGTARGERTTIEFPSMDGLLVTADVYLEHDASAPFIVLCHQARWSRGEYREIAPRLNELGFNCMAIDQRSGDAVNDVVNETVRRAKVEERGMTYVDAMADVEAALRYARAQYAKGKLIAWGSSYSASLVLKAASDEPTLADGVVAFAPGEYFVQLGKPKTWVRDAAKKITVPVFITSARREAKSWTSIYEAIPPGRKVAFVPGTPGNHGSRALWAEFEDSEAYWTSLEHFLSENFDRPEGRPGGAAREGAPDGVNRSENGPGAR